MFIKSDFLTVPVATFKLNKKAKSILLANFPKKYIVDDNGDSVLVFDKLYVANDQHTVNMTSGTDKILKLLGTSISSFQEQDWHGIEAAWFNFKYVLPESTVISKQSIYAEIFRHNDVGVKCSAQFNFISYDTLTPASDIIDDFNAGTALSKYGHLPTQVNSIPLLADGSRDPSFVNQDDQNWYIAYADVWQQAFTRKFSVKAATSTREVIGTTKVYSNGEYVSTPKYRTIYTTTIVMEYSRKASIPVAISLDPMLSRVVANNVYDSRFIDNYFVVADPDSIYAGISTYETIYTTDEDGNSDYIEVANTEKYLRVDAVTAMKLKTFAKIIGASLSFDYALKEVEWWMKVVAVIIIIIIIIIAVVLTPVTAGQDWWVAVGAIASVVAITATVISIALTLYLEELAKQGFVGGTSMIQQTILLAQDIAKYAGYVGMICGISSILANGFNTVGTAASSSAVPSGATVTGTNAAGAITYTLPMSTSAIVAQVTSWIGSGGNIALEYMNDKVGEDLAARQGQVDAQVALLEDYSSPKATVALQKDFDTYAFMDVNAKMDSMPYKLTQGFITESTLKYYD